MKTNVLRFAMRSSVAAAITAVASLAPATLAQESGADTAQASGEVEEVIVVGSRRRDRSAADSPVPVDVVQGDDFLAHGASNLDDLIASLVPSYNVSQEPISDAATFIRPATLRGLAPDATLVLVNGKRRHQGSSDCTCSVRVSQADRRDQMFPSFRRSPWTDSKFCVTALPHSTGPTPSPAS